MSGGIGRGLDAAAGVPAVVTRYEDAATSDAAWLAAKARSYWRDALKIEREVGDIEGLTGKQWAMVYRAVSAELNQCAKEARS